MAGGCCWTGRGGIGGGVPRKPVEGKGGGGGGRGGGGGGGVLELWPAVRAGDWGLLSEKPELELEGRRNTNEVETVVVHCCGSLSLSEYLRKRSPTGKKEAGLWSPCASCAKFER